MKKAKKKKRAISLARKSKKNNSVIEALISEDFIELYNVLHAFRNKLEWNAVLGFVRGLRFSARLIYIMRKRLKGKNLSVDWGHIVHDNGKQFSRECDIIIYKGPIVQSWNGHGDRDPVMSFKFVESKNVVAVISCKSMILGSQVDKEFAENVKSYARKIYLFAECCPKGKFEEIKKKAIKVGYKKFWCLYEWDKKNPEYAEKKETNWLEFTSHIVKFE